MYHESPYRPPQFSFQDSTQNEYSCHRDLTPSQLNASIHHAIPSITQRAVRDFGGKMVADSINDLIRHFTTADIDKVADVIIEKASDEFLDKCLEKRLLTIEALPLTNALAKAERLGYEPNDAIPEQPRDRTSHEAYPGAAAAAPPNGYQAHNSQPPPQSQPAVAPPPRVVSQQQQLLQCTRCFRTFAHASFFDYHMRFNVCSQIPPNTQGFEHSCRHCGQGFVGMDEMQQHLSNKVCGNTDHPEPQLQTPSSQTKVPRGPGRPPRTLPVHIPSPVTIMPSASSQSPAPTGRPAAMPQAMPIPTGGHDPYAHLTPATLAAMNEELHAAELRYRPRFAEAEEIQDENERRAKIEGLRNSFGTKQSMIRKKYGVRLRERRTKAEISAERERLGLKRAEREERARASVGAPTATPTAAAAVDTSPRIVSDVAPLPTNSGWNAVNTPNAASVWEEHNAKRRRMDETGGYQTRYKTLADETPYHKAAAAAQSSPTNQTAASSSGAAVNGHDTGAGSDTQPMVIDEDSSSSDDDDIPAILPESVRKGLTTPRGKQPASSPSSSATPP
ncbi:hypothetical protein QBC35DRAFT_249730 [Podospora australis]|uniref:Uncharacterized protein n=1 Tax=Podospora australis TaxID=1536484 RepID=A0AAN7AFX0_9PEZI|nr:hypothetical protein QBC35DRAFT_249730 [Podospora australis]